MGAGILTIWHKGEIVKIKEWFHRIGDKIVVPRIPFVNIFVPYNHGDSEIWVEFVKNKMILGCSIWDDIGKAYSTIMVQELAKYYKLKNAGWDSVGYCLSEFLKSEGLLVRILRGKLEFKEIVFQMEKINQILRKEAIDLVRK